MDAKGTQAGPLHCCLILFLKDPPQMHPHPWTHLRAGRSWPWVERCCHQATQQQLVHLRVLQQHQFQQVWGGGGGFSKPTQVSHGPLPTAGIPGPPRPPSRPHLPTPAWGRAGGRCSEEAQRMCEADSGYIAGEPGVSPSFTRPGCGGGGGAAHARGCRTVTQGWGGSGRLSQARRARNGDQLLLTPRPCTPRVAP